VYVYLHLKAVKTSYVTNAWPLSCAEAAKPAGLEQRDTSRRLHH